MLQTTHQQIIDQCNQHWFRVLQFAVAENWTEEENERLVQLSKQKLNWKTVAAEIGNGRTEAQCKFQSKYLELLEVQQAQSPKKRKQFVSESEDEEEEEPAESPVIIKKVKKSTEEPPVLISTTPTPKAILFLEDDDPLVTSTTSADSDSISTFDAFDYDSMISVGSERFSPSLADAFLNASFLEEDYNDINAQFESPTPFVPPFGDV